MDSMHQLLISIQENKDYRFPRQELEQLIQNRDQSIPVLLDYLQDVIKNFDDYYEQKALIGHLYAFYLLAQFRETRAYPLIAELFLRHGDRAEEFCGDFVTEDLARVLASVFDGDLAPIKQLIETTTVNDWVRSAAVSTLTILTLHDQLSRNEVIAYFRELLTEKLERQYNEVWNGVIIEAWHLYPDELQDEIAQAYEEGFADESMLGASAIGEALATDQETHIAQTRNNSHYQLITDTIAEMEWWAAFRKPQARSPKLELPKLSPPSPLTPKPTPLAPKPSIGRNDPCHCGSGKKYKKCCWPN